MGCVWLSQAKDGLSETDSHEKSGWCLFLRKYISQKVTLKVFTNHDDKNRYTFTATILLYVFPLYGCVCIYGVLNYSWPNFRAEQFGLRQIYSTASTVIYQGGRFGDQKSHWQMAIHHTFVRRGVSKCHNLKMVCVKLIHMKDKVGGGWCFFSWKYISEKATLKVFTTIKRDTHLQQHCICWTTVRKAYFVHYAMLKKCLCILQYYTVLVEPPWRGPCKMCKTILLGVIFQLHF